ncbi:hypothetical protein BLOT_008163 [Blomia tropicalis]|nr:hypothetical protein BLOT_008163 [Blomia tropicalis]
MSHSEFWRNDIKSINSKEEVDRFTSSIFTDIVNACEQTLPIMKPRNRIVPWWNPHLTKLRKTAKRWKKKCLRARNGTLLEIYLTQYKQHQSAYRSALKTAKREGWRNFIGNQNNESVWSKVYRLCRNPGRKPPSTVRRIDGTYTTDAQSTADYLLKQFLPDDLPNDDNQSYGNIRILANCYCGDNELGLDDHLFSHEEIEGTVNNQNDRKSPGKDGLSANIFKTVYSIAFDVIDKLFNLCLTYEPIVLYAAEAWSSALEYEWANKILDRIQRNFLLRICKGYRSISYDAIRIIANLPPLSKKVNFSVKFKETCRTGLLTLPSGTVPIQIKSNNRRHPATKVLGYVDLNRTLEHKVKSTMRIYTDGSKSDAGVGSAFLNYTTTQFLSGHGKFAGYLFDKKRRRSPTCRCGEFQDVEHLMFACPDTNDLRDHMERSCFFSNLTYEVTKLPTILADNSLSTTIKQFFFELHRRLCQWEAESEADFEDLFYI